MLKIKVTEVSGGISVEHACQEALDLSQKLGVMVAFKLNGTRVFIWPEHTLENVIDQYDGTREDEKQKKSDRPKTNRKWEGLRTGMDDWGNLETPKTNRITWTEPRYAVNTENQITVVDVQISCTVAEAIDMQRREAGRKPPTEYELLYSFMATHRARLE